MGFMKELYDIFSVWYCKLEELLFNEYLEMLEFFKEVNVVKLIKGLEDKLCIDWFE